MAPRRRGWAGRTVSGSRGRDNQGGNEGGNELDWEVGDDLAKAVGFHARSVQAAAVRRWGRPIIPARRFSWARIGGQSLRLPGSADRHGVLDQPSKISSGRSQRLRDSGPASGRAPGRMFMACWPRRTRAVLRDPKEPLSLWDLSNESFATRRRIPAHGVHPGEPHRPAGATSHQTSRAHADAGHRISRYSRCSQSVTSDRKRLISNSFNRTK